jgi:DNA-directed RNA polymerase specialized sigma24 family protein
MAREKWLRLLENQPEHYQEVIRLRYLGYNATDIANRVGLDEGTVRRIMRKVFQEAWQ